MPPKTTDERAEVESLLETIEDEGWTVVEYDADVDPYNSRSEVKIRVER